MAFLAQSVDLTAATRYSAEAERIPAAWMALVEIVARVDREPYRWPIGKTIFQKMAYFATQKGLPTRLKFRRDSYGPFSKDVNPMLTRLVNNGLLQQEQQGERFMVSPGITYAEAAQTYRGNLREWEPVISEVTDLFLRMNTHEAEIIATAHFAAQELAEDTAQFVTERAIFESVKAWKQRRKPPIAETEIAQAIRDLNLLGWITALPDNTLPLPEHELLEI